ELFGLERKLPREVSAHRHETGVANRELPGHPVDDVERHREDDVHPDNRRDVDQEIPLADRELQRSEHRDGEEEGEHAPKPPRQPRGDRQGRRRHQTFSAATRPNRPSGRTKRTTMRKPNTTASRQLEAVEATPKSPARPGNTAPGPHTRTRPMPPRTRAANTDA